MDTNQIEQALQQHKNIRMLLLTHSITRTTKPDVAPFLQRLCYSMQQYYRSVDTRQSRRFLAVLCIAMLSIPMMLIKMGKKVGVLKNANWATADIEGAEAVPIYDTGMSRSMYRLLAQSNPDLVKTHRQRNYRIWLDALDQESVKTKAQPVFSTLPKGCCPLYFPLIVANPAQLVQALKHHDIESFNWWHHQHPSVD